MPSIIAQKSEYTFKANQNIGRHGWLRLTPAYSVKLVNKLLSSSDRESIILDPFSGTATTGLVAAEKGNNAITFDINPFLVWFGNVKCQNYSGSYLEAIKLRTQKALCQYKKNPDGEYWIPPIHNINRWWSGQTLKLLSALRFALVSEFGEPLEPNTCGLVWIAFCRLIIETSSAVFNHVSMSFDDEKIQCYQVEYISQFFWEIFEFILESAKIQILGSAKVIEQDARDFTNLGDLKCDRAIASPPYPNRMSYIRELRPYMYWTKFLNEAREAGELDWLAIGGTWGIATSRLQSWQIQEKDFPQEVYSVVEAIRESDGKNAHLLSTYVLKYFHDMYLHFKSLRTILNKNADLFYVVGNSSFFGNMVDTPGLLAASLEILGYSDIHSEVIRKRNCKKSLYEYCLYAKWNDTSLT